MPTVNWDDVPDSTLLENNLYEFQVDALEKLTSGAGNLMYKGTFRVVAPDTYAGVPVFEYYALGSPDDPDAKDPEKVAASPGIRNLKRLFKATMIPLAGEIDDMVAQAVGQHFVGAVQQKTETKEGPYKDSKKNVINGYYPLGSRRVGGGAGAPAQARQTAPGSTIAGAAKPAAAAAPRAAKPAPAPTVTCPYCNEPMARAEYSAHVKTKHPDEG